MVIKPDVDVIDWVVSLNDLNDVYLFGKTQVVPLPKRGG